MADTSDAIGSNGPRRKRAPLMTDENLDRDGSGSGGHLRPAEIGREHELPPVRQVEPARAELERRRNDETESPCGGRSVIGWFVANGDSSARAFRQQDGEA